MKKATREETRIHNLRMILRTTYDSGTISRAEIARSTKLTPTTVSELAEILLAEQLIAAVGLGSSGGGKPPTLLTVPENARLAIGLDLSGNTWRASVINLRGKILRSAALPYPMEGGNPSIERIYPLIDELVAGIAPDAFLGIGIGCPGIINETDGVVQSAVKYRWENLPLRAILQEHYHAPVVIANDSHVAALAEYHFGRAKQGKSLVLLMVGDGISAGIILNGKIYSGDGLGAGEIGHIVVVPAGLPCRCGHAGCLETVASERAVIRLAREVYGAAPETSDAQILQRLQFESSSNNSAARRIVRQAGAYLGLAAANIIGLLNVQQIVLAGSLACLGDALLEPMVDAAGQKALDTLARQTRISISTLGDEIVQLGAAALVQQEILGIF